MTSHLQLSDDLLDRYNRPTPRYTSYPPAPHWGDAGPAHLIGALEKSTRPLSVYMHIPFCERLCLYCGCNVIINKDHSAADAYVARLIAEMDLLVAAHGHRVNQVHWGGGTPTYLDCRQITELFNALRTRFCLDDNAEVSIEIDPRVTTLEQLVTLRSAGFNRLSVGVQDFDPIVQQAVRRIQPFAMTSELIEQARSLNFDSINLDLIYGLPMQTLTSFERTLQQVLRLSPDRIAMFSYAHVPSLKHQQRSFEKDLPTESEKSDLFLMGLQTLTSHGYEHIGLDHFARPDDPLAIARATGSLHRNFQGYTTHAETDLIALGVSSISHVGNTYAQNYRELAPYNNAIDEKRLPVFRGYVMSADDEIRAAVIESVLCNRVVRKLDIQSAFSISFDDYFGFELDRLSEFQRDDLVEMDSREIRVTDVGRFFVRSIAQVFDAFAPAGVASKAV